MIEFFFIEMSFFSNTHKPDMSFDIYADVNNNHNIEEDVRDLSLWTYVMC